MSGSERTQFDVSRFAQALSDADFAHAGEWTPDGSDAPVETAVPGPRPHRHHGDPPADDLGPQPGPGAEGHLDVDSPVLQRLRHAFTAHREGDLDAAGVRRILDEVRTGLEEQRQALRESSSRDVDPPDAAQREIEAAFDDHLEAVAGMVALLDSPADGALEALTGRVQHAANRLAAAFRQFTDQQDENIMVTCLRCGRAYPPDARQCGPCGIALLPL